MSGPSLSHSVLPLSFRLRLYISARSNLLAQVPIIRHKLSCRSIRQLGRERASVLDVSTNGREVLNKLRGANGASMSTSADRTWCTLSHHTAVPCRSGEGRRCASLLRSRFAPPATTAFECVVSRRITTISSCTKSKVPSHETRYDISTGTDTVHRSASTETHAKFGCPNVPAHPTQQRTGRSGS